MNRLSSTYSVKQVGTRSEIVLELKLKYDDNGAFVGSRNKPRNEGQRIVEVFKQRRR